MRHVTVNYVAPGEGGGPSGEARLRRATFLVENADHLHRHRLADGAVLDIVLVGDVAALSPEFLAALDRPSCRGHVASNRYAALVERFPRLAGTYGGPYRTHVFAFLRWLLIDQLFPGEPVLCYDGDIIHNVPLTALGLAFEGITATATSTAFAAIANRDWFRAWERQLVAFDADIAGFRGGRAAAIERLGCRFEASPEEFFAKILIEAGDLPQDPLPEAFPYWVIPQPQILPRLYSFVRTRGGPAGIPTPMRYSRRAGIDHIHERPVAFWHLQKPFLSQLAAVAIQREVGQGADVKRVPSMNFYGTIPTAEAMRRIDPYHDEGGCMIPVPGQRALAVEMLRTEQRLWQALSWSTANPFSPAFLYEYYFRRHDFGRVFDERAWPAAGAWGGSEHDPSPHSHRLEQVR